MMDIRPTLPAQPLPQTLSQTATPAAAFAPSRPLTSFFSSSSAAAVASASSLRSPLRPPPSRPAAAPHTTTRRTAAPSAAPTRVAPRAAADFYEMLGVSRSASDSDIKSAFRQKARKLHPDVNKAPDAKERFQEISRAYEVLSDSDMRQRYDTFGEAGVSSSAASSGGQGFGDFSQDFGSFSDIFDTFFGGQAGGSGQSARSRRRSGPQPGDDLRLDVDVAFEKAVFGAEQKIRFSHLETCGTCTGSGVKPGSRPKSCSGCNGSGSVTQVVNTPLGMFQQTSTCSTCRGTGEVVDDYCGACGGRGRNQVTKQLMITIPAGVDTGSRLRIRNEGDAGQKSGPPGDLYVMLRVKDSSDFKRDGVNLYSKVSISYLDAILGRAISVKTVDGDEQVDISSGTQPGAVVRIDKKGVPKLGNSSVRGDLFITIDVKIPTRLSSAEKSLMVELDELAGNSSKKGNGKVPASSGSDGEKGRKASKNRGEGFFNFGKK